VAAARRSHGHAERDARDAGSKPWRSILSSEDGRFGEERERSEGKDERESMSHGSWVFNIPASRQFRRTRRFFFGKNANPRAV
jgi:hypothetical protein